MPKHVNKCTGAAAALATIVLVALVAHGGGHQRATAQQAPQIDNATWIQTVEDSADLDTDKAKKALDDCLHADLNAGKARYDALRHCALVAHVADEDPNAETDADDVLLSFAQGDPRKAASSAATHGLPTVLKALVAQGFTEDQLTQIAPQLYECLTAWTTLLGTEALTGDLLDTEHVGMQNAVIQQCVSEVAGVNKRIDDLLSKVKPAISDVGCPDSVAVNDSVQCTPHVVYATKGAGYSWVADAGSPHDALTKQFTTSFSSAGDHEVALVVCNNLDDDQTCAGTSAKVTVTGGQAPSVTALGCPTPVPAGQAITCTPTGQMNVTSSTTWAWSAPGGQGGDAGGTTFTVTFATGGDQTVTLTLCDAQQNCSTTPQTVTVVAPPTITSLGCSPGSAPLSVSCTASLQGATTSTTESWATSGSSNDSGTGDPYATTFSTDGTKTITLTACNTTPNGNACAPPQSTTVTLTAPPSIDSMGCSPSKPFTGDTVSCSVTARGTVTSITWSAPNGQPASGTGVTFATSYQSTGGQTITVTACNGSACATKSQDLEVFRKQVAATPSPTPRAPVTTNGSISVTEGDIGCAFSAMPSTTGTITMTLTYGTNPGDLVVARGSLNGGGSGSRQVSCHDATGTLIWNAQYNGTFTGGIDPSNGTGVLTGSITITQNMRASNCSDSSGPVGCSQPGYAPHPTYTMRVYVTINPQTGTGSGSIQIDSGCSTAGTWRSGQ